MNLLSQKKELNDLVDEVQDRFGKMPQSLRRLFAVLKLKILAQKNNVRVIKETEKDVLIEWSNKKYQRIKVRGLTSEEKIKKLSASLK
jgi:transcription-repair coupling factor (superfamily II helicase)